MAVAAAAASSRVAWDRIRWPVRELDVMEPDSMTVEAEAAAAATTEEEARTATEAAAVDATRRMLMVAIGRANSTCFVSTQAMLLGIMSEGIQTK